MSKNRKDWILIGVVILIGALWITGVVMEYLIDTRQRDQIQELRSRIEKIEANRKE